ncbi:hypothetical protein [Actinokineospora iranica]|uniref:hypothetical protein n=1 Tax=Actinokineospora iranica TaxID=1271860 RepID=UPI001113FBF2|nr:hypothetical protein [Actinokineospora iranica]
MTSRQAASADYQVPGGYRPSGGAVPDRRPSPTTNPTSVSTADVNQHHHHLTHYPDNRPAPPADHAATAA